MTVRFEGFDVRHLFSHALLWGAAVIAEDAGTTGVRVSWSGPGLSPVAEVSGVGLDEHRLAEVVREHARAREAADGWVRQPFPAEPERGLFSPRVKAMGDDPGTWETYGQARHQALDSLERSVGDLRMIGALGEPAWWVHRPDGSIDQDVGASRLEMQPRNRGSEFVASRLRPLTGVVARRPPARVVAGLIGTAVEDQTGKGASDSRTATNLRPLGPTDDAAGYVALWGLSCSTVVPTRRGAQTSVSVPLGAARPTHFAVPVWAGAWTTARLRAVLASEALALTAADLLGSQRVDPPAVAVRWLREHGVRGLVSIPVTVTGSASAPERRAVTGRSLPLTGA